MKTMKKLLVVVALIAISLSVISVNAFAASRYQTPAEAVAGLTGRTVQSVINERLNTGKTYGTIAYEAGVLDKFKTDMLQMHKDALDVRVKAGIITQAQANTYAAAYEKQVALCDGTGQGCALDGLGLGLGLGGGNGASLGSGMGLGGGNGANRGLGLRDGSCLSR